MKRIRLGLLPAIVVALAIAVAAPSAQAHEYRVEGTSVSIHFNLVHKHFTVLSILGTPFGVALHLLCLFEFLMGILPFGRGLQVVSLLHCTVTKPANCTVKEPIELKMASELVGSSPGVEIELKPESGETLGTITLEGASCSLKGKPFELAGTQTCSLPGVEAEAVVHEMTCSTSGSKLKAGGKTATLEASMPELELESKQKWSAL